MVLSVKRYVELRGDMVVESNSVVSLSIDAKTSAQEVIIW